MSSRRLRLPGSFYHGDTLDVAQRLLGKLLVSKTAHQQTSGIIVEVEAYLHQHDPASHSHRGLTRRNAAMFMAPGTLYVYSIHAKYCLNIVTEAPNIGAAVLIRALEPWDGIELMQERRARTGLRDLSSGPARLCQALSIDTTDDRTDLVESDHIWLEASPVEVINKSWQASQSPRIGISSAVDAPYRFFIDGHYCVSGLARLHKSKREWTFRQSLA